MLLTRLTPAPGVALETALPILRDQSTAIGNLTGHSAHERLSSYHASTPQASHALGYVVAPEQVDSLVATHRHDALVARAPGYNRRS